MAIAAGYTATVKIAGSPVSFTNEAMTRIHSRQYQITDATKRLWSKGIAVNIRRNNNPVARTSFRVDYLFGLVTFDSAVNQAANMSVSSSHYPTTTIVGAMSYNLSLTGDVLDNTDFEAFHDGMRTKQYGLLDVSASLERYDDLTGNFFDTTKDRERVLLEFTPASGSIARGWFVAESDNRSGDIASLETESLSFQLDAGNGPATDPSVDFSWRD